MALLSPTALAFLQKPESHHILEQACGTEDATFIREIGGQCLRRHNWMVKFDTHQRPRARTDIAPATRQPGGRCRNGRACIMRRWGHYSRRTQIVAPFRY